ncbi:MAG: hypothetical protein Mars2KO_37950 [Maribacter sp.]
MLQVLRKIQVLPFEHASESREIYERAHKAVALSYLQKNKNEKALEVLKKSKEWPENIGVGKPYDPDERSQDYLMALAMEKIGNLDDSKTLLTAIVNRTEKDLDKNSMDHLFGILAAKKLENGSLNKLINALKTTENEKSATAIALFNARPEDLIDLQTKSGLPTDVWETVLWVIQN